MPDSPLTPEELERIERSLGGECAICDATTRRLVAEVCRLRAELTRELETSYRPRTYRDRAEAAELRAEKAEAEIERLRADLALLAQLRSMPEFDSMVAGIAVVASVGNEHDAAWTLLLRLLRGGE